MHVPATRHKCHCQRCKEILDGYNNFGAYAVIVFLRATTNFGHSYVRFSMTSEVIRVISRLYYKIRNTTLS